MTHPDQEHASLLAFRNPHTSRYASSVPSARVADPLHNGPAPRASPRDDPRASIKDASTRARRRGWGEKAAGNSPSANTQSTAQALRRMYYLLSRRARCCVNSTAHVAGAHKLAFHATP